MQSEVKLQYLISLACLVIKVKNTASKKVCEHKWDILNLMNAFAPTLEHIHDREVLRVHSTQASGTKRKRSSPSHLPSPYGAGNKAGPVSRLRVQVVRTLDRSVHLTEGCSPRGSGQLR